MGYEVFDTDINRLFGTYETEKEAMMLARALITANGEAYAEDLAVGHDRADGTFEGPWTGAALIARADEVLAEHEPAAAGPTELVPSRGNKARSGTGMPMAASGRTRLARTSDGTQRAIPRNRRPRVVQTPNGTRRRKG